jgi:pyruvate/2-oxoglutarate dehydrogenase complex dihydrolipoamide dehydrogenase (E3) component
MNDVIIIGGGPAGVTAALRARELGAEVALVEKGRLGGTCINDGVVPTRVWARAARLRRDFEQLSAYGWLAEPPVLDYNRLLTRTLQVVYQVHEKKQLIDRLETAGVSVYSEAGKAWFSDTNTIQTEKGHTLQAGKFILCAGGHARLPSFPGKEYVMTHHDIWSVDRLPDSVVIAGGGATGCQLATILTALGCRVWLMEMNPEILAIEDPQVSQTMRRALVKRGVDIITGISGIEAVEKTDDGYYLTYTQAEQSQLIKCQAVILASGWPGNADELNPQVAGVETRRGYVVVDDHLCTTASHIFAAGDITGRMMLVQSAGLEARIAAENAILTPVERSSHQIVPHGGFTDPEYASVGMTEPQAMASGQEYLVATTQYADLDRAVIDGYTEGFFKLIVSQENHRILGAHAVGEQAVELIQIVAASITADMWVEQMAEMEFSYPTYTAIAGITARKAVYALGVMPLAPQWRTLGRSVAAEWESGEGS